MKAGLLALADPSVWPSSDASPLRAVFAALMVLALLVLFAWLLKRGGILKGVRRKNPLMNVETAVPLGERRSLVIVSVEGRRLLLGLTPVHISFLSELKAGQDFGQALDRTLGPSGSN